MRASETPKIIIKCPECKKKLSLPPFRSKKLNVKCPKCSTKFIFDCKKYRIKQATILICIVVIGVLLLVADTGLPFFLMSKVNINISKYKENQEQNNNRVNVEFSNELDALRRKYDKRIREVDTKELKQKAKDHYTGIWIERSNYNSRYAITTREKAQLEMLALAKDSNKSIEEIVESIAVIAAPKNSEVKAYTVASGVILDINFDMSEVTKGEEGAKTKHANKSSLKKETIRLISKVTTDVYEFCRDLDLETIYIGCKHFVTVDYRNGTSSVEDLVIYKVKLDRKNIKKLEHNPFLDIYSVTKCFEIEEDGFPNLYLDKIS